jgi:tripartite ATP-independent transporter DctP family solute receptor
MKKLNYSWIMAVLITVMMLWTAGSVFAGGGQQGASGGAADGQPVTLRLATASPEDTVTDILAKKFIEEVNKSGQFKVEYYPNSSLGGDVEILESLQAGDIGFIVQTTAPALDFVPEVGVFDLPFAHPDIQSLRTAVNRPGFRGKIDQAYQKGGFKVLAMADQSFRELSSNRPVRQFSDFRGQKIRTMENANHLAFWRAVGANPTPMAFAEVYIGLQQGTIDGQENPIEVIVANRLYEVQNYVINVHWVPHMLMLITNNSLYSGLSAAQKKIIDDAATVAQQEAYRQCDARISAREQIVKDSGTEILPVSQDLYNQTVKAADSVYTLIRGKVGDALVNDYLGK